MTSPTADHRIHRDRRGHLAVVLSTGCSSQTLFLVMDVVETAWNFEIEDKLGKDLEAFIG